MNWESIEELWKEQKTNKTTNENIPMLLNDVQQMNKAFRRSIFWRDVREVGVSFAMTAIFIIVSIPSPPLAKYGALFMAASSLFVGLVLLWTQWKSKRKLAQFPASVKGDLEADLWHLSFQEYLLRNVKWWYLLPLAIGLVAWMGSSAAVASWPVAIILIIGIVGIIYPTFRWVNNLNQKAIEKEIHPKQESIKAILRQWES